MTKLKNKSISEMNDAKQNIKPGYKLTAVGVIPEEWEVKRLGEIGDIITGSTPNTSKTEYYDGEELFVSPADIKENIFVYNTEKKLTYLGLKQGRIIPKYSIMFVCIGSTIGKVSISGKSLITNQQINSIIPAKCIHYYYLFNILKHCSKKIQLLAANQAVPILNKTEFSKIQLPIPPLSEQTAIANCLGTWDKGIDTLASLIEAKMQQKKWLMQNLLTGKKRLPGFEGEWKEVRLGSYFKDRNETGYNDLELLSIGEDGVYPQSESNKKDTSNSDKSKYKLIKNNDIGYNTMRLWQGRLALSSLTGIVSPAYTILEPKTEKVNPVFFSYYFKVPFVVHFFYRNSQGMVSDTLSCKYTHFKKIKLPIPSLPEQTAIASILSTADKEIELLQQKLDAMKEQKRGLMQVLLTGKVRLKGEEQN